MNNCLVCNIDYVKKSLLQKYCSLRCRAKFRNRKKYEKFKVRFKSEHKPEINISCINCGIIFKHTNKIRKYCSIACKDIKTNLNNRIRFKDRYLQIKLLRNTSSINKNCVHCNIIFSTHKKRKKFCSSACSLKFRFTNKATIKDNKKKRVINKSGACDYCNFKIRHALQVHHINNGIIDNGYNNLMTLCANCHNIYHGVVGRNKKTENQNKEFVIDIINKEIQQWNR